MRSCAAPSRRLAAARDRYRDLYDYAPTGYLTVGRDGRILQANLTCERLLGLERDALPRHLFSDFVARDDQDAYHLFRQRLRPTDTAQTVDLDDACGRHAFRAHLEVTSALPIAAGPTEQEPVSHMTMIDVTQVHALQEQERRMLYTVAHDLRVPATIIKGYLQLLLDLLPAGTMTEPGCSSSRRCSARCSGWS